MKKIVAMGGGEIGRTKSDGTVLPYETDLIDQEIIRLTGKETPNVLVLAHASMTLEVEKNYHKVVKKVYEDKYGCSCKTISQEELRKQSVDVDSLIDWADIIYEGGGDTIAMVKLWKETGFDKKLKQAWEDGKVLCGTSAGAICWFTCGGTLHPDYIDKIPNVIDGLGFIDAYFSPHSQIDWKHDSIKGTLKCIDKVGLALSNCAAIEIVDDKYRIIKTESLWLKDLKPFVTKSYWKDDEYIEEDLDDTEEFKDVKQLLKK